MIVKVLLALALLGLSESSPRPHPAPLQHAVTPLQHAATPLQLAGLQATPRGYTQQVALLPNTQPRHVHLAYGGSTDEVVVTWSTIAITATPQVQWGTDLFHLGSSGAGWSKEFPAQPGSIASIQYVHRVHMHHLEPNTTYYYHCGSADGWSPVFGFRTVPAGTTGWPLRMAVYGDLGVINARSLSRLQEEAHQGMYDAVLHVGDFAYDMNVDNGAVGDTFMDQIEPIAAYLPYMTCPGNHEAADDFHQYRGRFSMPNYNATESLYSSFDIGPVHFVAVSTEVYYYTDALERVKKQYKWLEQDLKYASAPANRTERPWIVLFGHRPMYCSPNDDLDNCHFRNTLTRVGLSVNNTFIGGMESLLLEYGVDLAIWAHEHTYERLYPMYNYTVYKDSPDPYNNPRAPVHITTGSAGCQEDLDVWQNYQPEWSAKQLYEYGYTRLTVINSSHLTLDQVHDTDGSISDHITLVRDSHTYPPLD